MNTKAQLYANLFLYNIKSRSHTSTILIDSTFRLHYMIKEGKIDVAQVISNEIQKISISGHSHGNKAPMNLGFPAFIMGLCRKEGVDIPNVATKRISSILNDDYVLRHCVPKSEGEAAPQPQAHTSPVGLARTCMKVVVLFAKFQDAISSHIYFQSIKMSSRANQGKCSRYAAGSSSHSRQSAETEHLEFNNTHFIGPLQEARYYSLDERQIWPEKIFTLNPQGDYQYFVDDMEKIKWGVLLNPPTDINFDIIREFYANSIPIEDVWYSYCSFIRGRAVSFDRNLVSQYLNRPLTLQRGELFSYKKMVASKKWRLDLVSETLALTPNHGFFLNASNQLVHFKRCDMNIKAQLYATLLLYNIKLRSHTSTIIIDSACLLHYMIKGWHIDVAQVISNEIRNISISGHSHGNKVPMTLGFLDLITGLCRKAGVDIPNVSTKSISSIVNDDYVLRHCVPKLEREAALQPQAHAPPAGLARYNEQ
ncbi:hypothetical protein RYX36_022761 [Vicia faba]